MGYCDAQCPHDMKFINGDANVEGWKPSDNDENAGTRKWGAQGQTEVHVRLAQVIPRMWRATMHQHQ
jgi:hypothetical protein